jgi:hypothetical protein
LAVTLHQRGVAHHIGSKNGSMRFSTAFFKTTYARGMHRSRSRRHCIAALLCMHWKVWNGSKPDVALRDFGMYIPIGAPERMKLGTLAPIGPAFDVQCKKLALGASLVQHRADAVSQCPRSTIPG